MELAVQEAIQDDVNTGLVRVDLDLMRQLEVKPGEVVELEGERTTAAIVDCCYPGDIGYNIIRMDGLTRRNAKTCIGKLVKIQKSLVKEAEKVVIAPASPEIIVKAPSGMFKQGLLGRAVMKGDIVSLGGTRARRNTMARSPLFGDIFDIINEDMLGIGFSDIRFLVQDTHPEGAVVISEATQVAFRPTLVVGRHEAGGVMEVALSPLPLGWLRFHRESGVVELERATLAEILGVKPEEIKESRVV